MQERPTFDQHHQPPWPAPPRRLAPLVLALLVALIGGTFAFTRSAYAAAITVDGTTCTLIDAITAANSDTATGGCPAGSDADTITLTADVTLTAVDNGDYIGSNGLPQISSDITIEGGGHTLSRAASAPAFRFFYVQSGGVLTLNGLTLQNGAISNSAALGGGIYNQGTLTVNNSTISGNTVGENGRGGGIYNQGTLTVNNSTISGNTVGQSGEGGGIYNQGTLTVNNSTISGNTVGEYGQGGGIVNNGRLTVNNSTISGNTAYEGGGIASYAWGAVATLNRSLISGNNANYGGPEINRPDGAVNADNYNLIGYGGDVRSSGFGPGATDIVPSQVLAQILNTTLQVNGSGPATLALVTGSPAIDAAGDSGLATDQRGVTRPQGTADDIGAFEAEAVVAASEIDVQGNSVSIASGDTTPSSADDTDFGRAAVGSASVVRTFTIRNTGTAALTLSGSPLVAVSGASAFSVSSQPAGSSVAAGSSTTFALTFNPSGNGVFTATVSIASNDSDENPYTFVVQGIRTGSNVALGKAATQSSTYNNNCGGPAAKAVDGNTSGNWGDCSVTHTEHDNQPWWQVDLGTTYLIDVIDLWNRTDVNSNFLSNFDLSISTDGTTWTSFYHPAAVNATTSFVINASVRYVKVQLRGTNYLALAEVQVWGPAIPDIDVQGNSVSIASGDTSPSSVDHTKFERITVTGDSSERTFTIRNAGAAPLALSGSPRVVLSGDSAFSISSQPASNSLAAGSSTTFALTFNPSGSGVFTATVSIASNDSDETPYTFVVQGIRTASNVAVGKAATQSSNTVADPCGAAVAARAVDGNTSGYWNDCSVAQTEPDNQGWWQVDLGATYPIDVIDLWRRTDDCCTGFLRNFDLSISTDGTSWTSFYYPGTAGVTTSFVINAPARYVKVQLRDNSYLMLAEVQVWGPALPDIDVQGNSTSIASGDTTPSSTDDTDFGRVAVGSASVVRTFTIRNVGDATLTLSGSPLVAVSGASAFSVSSQPASSSVAAGSSTTFALTFNPSGSGVFTATVSIANNDSDENPYTFVVQGIRTASNVAVGKAATQSSNTVADPCGAAVAARAVDGNTSGYWNDCSVAQTEPDNQGWWQVDLGATYPIDVIDLWRRTDDCCTGFLRNFDLSISTDGTSWTSFYYPGTAGVTTSFVINAPARYVKVQLRDNSYLMLAEVQVWGPALPDMNVQGNSTSIVSSDTTPSSTDGTDLVGRRWAAPVSCAPSRSRIPATPR